MDVQEQIKELQDQMLIMARAILLLQTVVLGPEHKKEVEDALREQKSETIN